MPRGEAESTGGGSPLSPGLVAQGFPGSNFRVIPIDTKTGIWDDLGKGAGAKVEKRRSVLSARHKAATSPVPVPCPAMNIYKVPNEDERRKVLMKEKDDLDINIILEQTRPLQLDLHMQPKRKLSGRGDEMWLHKPEPNRFADHRQATTISGSSREGTTRRTRKGPSSAQYLPERMKSRVQYKRSGSAVLGRSGEVDKGCLEHPSWPVMEEPHQKVSMVGSGGRGARPASRQKAPKEALDLFPEESKTNAADDQLATYFSSLFLDDVDEFAKKKKPPKHKPLPTSSSSSSSDPDFDVGGFNPSEVMVLESVDDLSSPEEKYFESLYGLLVQSKADDPPPQAPPSKDPQDQPPYPQLIRPQHPPMGKRKAFAKNGLGLKRTTR